MPLQSRAAEKEKGDRILTSRFAHRDKHWSNRTHQSNLSLKAKSRLVIVGLRDPDLTRGLPSHAPTVS